MAAPSTTIVAPIRTPMHDADGNLTRPWVLYYQQLGVSTSGAATSATLTPATRS